MTLLAVNTGMRKGELLSINWAYVHFEQAFLTIKAQNAKSGKTRHMPLNNEALDSLKAWQSLKSDTERVFEGDNAKPIGDFKKSRSKLIEDAQIEDFRFHDLRHHFASKLVMKGADLNTVRELLGHGNLEMTLRYAHLAPEHKSAAVGLL